MPSMYRFMPVRVSKGYGKYIMVSFDNDWDKVLDGEFAKGYYLALREFLKSEYSNYTVFPVMNNIFAAQKAVPYSSVRVVILGQDPYINPGQAHGMAFSVMPGVKAPPSLDNIFKELASDVGCVAPDSGYLAAWAKQGVLLLNTVLTVRAGSSNSHKGKGWETYTDTVIRLLSDRAEPMVFLLWGSNARSKRALIDSSRHLVLEAPHPSPLSAYNGFFGCKHFSECNKFLVESGFAPIDWQI